MIFSKVFLHFYSRYQSIFKIELTHMIIIIMVFIFFYYSWIFDLRFNVDLHLSIKHNPNQKGWSTIIFWLSNKLWNKDLINSHIIFSLIHTHINWVGLVYIYIVNIGPNTFNIFNNSHRIDLFLIIVNEIITYIIIL